MQQHLEVISEAFASGKHAVLVVDRAAWHITANASACQLVNPVLTTVFARTQYCCSATITLSDS